MTSLFCWKPANPISWAMRNWVQLNKPCTGQMGSIPLLWSVSEVLCNNLADCIVSPAFLVHFHSCKTQKEFDQGEGETKTLKIPHIALILAKFNDTYAKHLYHVLFLFKSTTSRGTDTLSFVFLKDLYAMDWSPSKVENCWACDTTLPSLTDDKFPTSTLLCLYMNLLSQTS